MNVVMESGLSTSVSDNRTLLDLFVSFVGSGINEIFWKPVSLNDYSDSDDILDEYERREKLKMASVALLKSVDNVNYTDNDGQTFLHHFIEIFLNDSTNLSADRLTVGLQIIQNLLDQGASVDIKDNEGYSPCQILLDNRQKDVLRLVLAKFNNFCICSINNCRDKQITNSNALHINSVDHVIEVLQCCLEHQIDFYVINSTNATPLMIVCMLSFIPFYESKILYLVDILIKGGYNVNAVDSKGCTALLYAIKTQHLEVVQKLIELGADVNQPTEYQLPPLYNSPLMSIWVEELQSMKQIKGFSKDSIDYDSVTCKNITPLMFAVLHSCGDDIVEYLIENGADVNCSEGISGFKPLHLAILNHKNDPDLFDFILEKESDINARTKCGLSPLNLASLTDNYSIFMGLLKLDADVDCRESNFGLTAMHFACMTVQNFYSMLKGCRRGYDATTLTVRFIAFFLSHYEEDEPSSSIITLLSKRGASVNVRDTLGKTPLHYATSCFNPLPCLDEDDLLPTLLELGAYVNRQDNNGLTPLDIIADQKIVPAFGYLLRYGADLSDIKTKCLDTVWFKHIYKYRCEDCYDDEQCKSNQVYRYIVKLEVAGLLGPDFPNLSGKGSNRQKYINLCQKYRSELSKMKKYLIEDRVSLYDWLRWNHTRAQPFYLNEVPSKLKSKFPIYYEVIQARYRMVTERIPLLKPAKLAWYQVTNIHLPEICVERILFHLSNRNLHFLVDQNEN